MTNLGQIVVLLYGSSSRFTSVHVTLRSWYLPELLSQALTRWAADQDAGSVSVLRPATPQEGSVRAYFVQLWTSRASNWRYEVGHNEATPEHIVVVNGPHWWVSNARTHELTTNEGTSAPHPRPVAQLLEEQDPALAEMLDPYRIIPYLWLDPQETVIYLGREAIRVKGLPRAAVVPDASPALLRLGTSGYEFLVDAERGVLLRWDAYLDGQAFAGWELLNASFDIDIADNIFAIAPAPDTAIHRVTRPRPPQIAY